MNSNDILNRIAVAKPCPADWAGMSGNEQVRFCGQCQKHVYNISEVPADEAVSLIQESEGDLCIRLYRRDDGTVLNGNCPVGVRQVWSRWKRLVGVAATAGVVALAAKLAPSLQAGVPRAQVAAPAAPAGPGPVMIALQDLSATIKDWLGITPEPTFCGSEMGEMIDMGGACMPEDWIDVGPVGVVEPGGIPPAPPSAIRRSDS